MQKVVFTAFLSQFKQHELSFLSSSKFWFQLSAKATMNYVRQEQDGSYRYELRLQPEDSGSFAYGVRVLPTHPALANKHDLGLIHWA